MSRKPEAVKWKLTQKQLKHYLSYDPKTGVFRWKNPRGKKCKAGDVAGSYNANLGYLEIGLNYHVYLGHYLAWMYVHGEWPEPTKEVDHKDGNTSNNAIKNLRVVTHKKNIRNSKKWSHNTSGVTGVHFGKTWNKWVAHIGKTRLGLFATKEEAVAVRLAAEKELNYSKRHGK